MKKIILTAFLLILSLNNIGCSPVQKNVENSASLSSQSDQKITLEDINDGKQVIKNHIDALRSGDLEALNKTLGRYKQGLYTNDNISHSTLVIETIEYPGQYLSGNIPPSSYRSNYGKDPYKSMCLHVIFSPHLTFYT